MAAAPAGTVAQTLVRADGSSLTVILCTDPGTGDWLTPGAIVTGTGTAQLAIEWDKGSTVLALAAGDDVDLAALAVPPPGADTFFGLVLSETQ